MPHCVTTRLGEKVPRPLGTALHARRPNEIIHFDFMHMSDLGDDGASSDMQTMEFTELLIIKDDLSGFCELIPCRRMSHMEVVTALLFWFSRFGVVHQWISDQGSHFKNLVLKEFKGSFRSRASFYFGIMSLVEWCTIERELIRMCYK